MEMDPFPYIKIIMKQNKKVAWILIICSILIIVLTPFIFYYNWYTIRLYTENFFNIKPWTDDFIVCGAYLSYHILMPYALALLMGMLGIRLMPIEK